MSGAWIAYLAMVALIKRIPLNQGCQTLSCSDTFATQFNLTSPFWKLPVRQRQMECSCVCTV